MADVTMPQLGETVTEGTITKWFKQVGDKVEEDEALFEVSTDKVDSEVPASTSGYLSEILVKEGETVDVGAKLAVISDQPAGAGGAGDSNGQVAAEPEAQGGRARGQGGRARGGGAGPGAGARIGRGGGRCGRSGRGGRSEPAPTADAGRGQARAPARSSPRAGLVRRTAGRSGPGRRPDGSSPPSSVDSSPSTTSTPTRSPAPATRTGSPATTSSPTSTGAQPAAGRPRPPPPPPHRRPRPRPPATVPATAGAGGDQVVPFSNIRRRTAEHMVRSLDTSAHVLTVIEVDFDNVERVRQAAKGKWKEEEGFSLTYLPFVSRAVIDAIRDFPHVNASVDGDSLVVHGAVNLGFAVDLNFEGLIVPVIHDADAKRMRSLARELADLAARARAKKLNADEIQGATFTITNPGGYGTLLTFPVINQPNVAIVSTDGVKKRPVVIELPDGSDAIAIHPVGNLALSFDHRAFDGAYASAFIARVQRHPRDPRLVPGAVTAAELVTRTAPRGR